MSSRRRFFEVSSIIIISLILLATMHLEVNLFRLSSRLSENKDFFTSVIYFGLINVNVILILVLSFLIFRNVIKLVIDRRRGVIGSKVRTKLVVALVFFAVAPTALMFYISSRFLTESFETWFSSRVEDTMHKTREAGALVYKRDKRRLESLVRIALQRLQIKEFPPELGGDLLDASRLEGFDTEYRLDSVKVFDLSGSLVWKNETESESEEVNHSSIGYFTLGAIDRFRKNVGMMSRGAVDVEGGRDVVRAAAPIYNRSHKLIGVIVAEERFETQIIQGVESILADFAGLKPGAQLIRASYTILLLVMVLIIVFSATWLGFYVARGIVGPIQSLAVATREVALGNYDIELFVETDDETGQLVRSFNRMTKDLKVNQQKVKRFTDELKNTNEELERRKKYWEVVLQNISAGVMSIDSNGQVASVNDSAERLLGINASEAIGQGVESAVGEYLNEVFWKPIAERMRITSSFNLEIVFEHGGENLTLLVDVSRILDENSTNLGVVIVFDDASEKVKVQRMVAWREVARRVAHEIKNPITPIKLSAQRLLRRFGDHFDGEEKKVFESAIETIILEVDGLRDLVNEFSKFSRLPSIKKKTENLNEVIAEIVRTYSMSYPQIEFRLDDLQAGLPMVPMDREQMSRVFRNVITNAIAAITGHRKEGLISFHTIYLESYNTVRVEIKDNGVGIPEKMRQRVIEPYFSTKSDGTGLGLAIVSQIINDHGGYLRIGGEEGAGAIIVIELPLGEERFAESRKSDSLTIQG